MNSVAVAPRGIWFRRQLSGRAIVLAAGISAALLVAGRGLGVADSASLQNFAIIFIAISTEALPFVLLGAFVAAAVETYVSDTAFSKITRLPSALQMPIGVAAGFTFPVCECGSVPVARRFMRRGMSPAAAVAFMLAAPIVNPVVLISTWVAYSPRGFGTQMVLGRAGLGLVLASVVGWALGTESATELLRARADDPGDEGHDHETPTAKRQAFIAHLTNDFLFMGKFLIFGAMLSAALQTTIPRSIFAGVAATPIIASLALMAVAFVSSLCSEADAFVAVSFNPFPAGAQLAFLVFGPVLDFKLAFLYGGTFRKRFVTRLALAAIPVVLAGSLWFEAAMRA